jgi:hypothetical protein
MNEKFADIALAVGIAFVLCGFALAYFDVLTY